MKIHCFDENSSLLVKADHSDEIPLVWWKCKTFMKMIIFYKQSYPFDGNSSLWWKFITLIKVLQFKKKLSTLTKTLCFNKKIGYLMKIHHFDEISSHWCKFVTLEKNFSSHCLIFWKLNTLLKKILNLMKNGYVNGRSWLDLDENPDESSSL